MITKKYFVLNETHQEVQSDLYETVDEALPVALELAETYAGSSFTICCKITGFTTELKHY